MAWYYRVCIRWFNMQCGCDRAEIQYPDCSIKCNFWIMPSLSMSTCKCKKKENKFSSFVWLFTRFTWLSNDENIFFVYIYRNWTIHSVATWLHVTRKVNATVRKKAQAVATTIVHTVQLSSLHYNSIHTKKRSYATFHAACQFLPHSISVLQIEREEKHSIPFPPNNFSVRTLSHTHESYKYEIFIFLSFATNEALSLRLLLSFFRVFVCVRALYSAFYHLK